MTLLEEIASTVNLGDFEELFVSVLGWDHPLDRRPVRCFGADGVQEICAIPIAAKRGVTVYHCEALLARQDLEQLDRHISRRSIERFVILDSNGEQQWRWPETRSSGGTRFVTHRHTTGTANLSLFQRLAAIRFELDEEGALTVLAVRDRIRTQFNSEEVTHRFYEDFQRNQQVLMSHIVGIPPDDDRSWYSSLLLNRLMFIYFMQKKRFLNNDSDYLRTSLRSIRNLRGSDKFYEYYRDFLIPLFHLGLGGEAHVYTDPQIASVIGKVPYVNGGIFSQHQLEAKYLGEITIPDETFGLIFDFFDRYRWHLDERATRCSDEINPEILGYIFEKYVNQKAQGAYYTKEDVTGYMSALAILPVLIDQISSTLGESPWYLLALDPDRYIPEGLRYGLDDVLEEGGGRSAIVRDGVGLDLDDFADGSLGLPGERWRETFDRHAYAASLRERLGGGSVTSSSDAVTANLDLQTMVLDWITSLRDAEQISKVWDTLLSVKILDPTCGSGAFLFAALDILEELYEATLAMAENFSLEAEGISDIMGAAKSHVSRRYFLVKTAVLANLYGVDLMQEATEIARLRLFLALASHLHDSSEIEPLPDLDMNIRSGNLLVGCSTPEDAVHRFASSLWASKQVEEIANDARSSGLVYREFVAAQNAQLPGSVVDGLKADFQEKTGVLRHQLDLLYSPHLEAGSEFESWRSTHQPFHWFVEFPEVMSKGGFDVVIGNPPYVRRTEQRPYSYSGFETDNAPDIYAPCMERASSLVRNPGSYAMIVPISFQFSGEYASARKVIANNLTKCWTSTFAIRPSSLFQNVVVRSTIVIGRRYDVLNVQAKNIYTTALRRWWKEFRPYLFDTIRYVEAPVVDSLMPWPRLGTSEIKEFYTRLIAARQSIGNDTVRGGFELGFKTTAGYFLSVFIDEPPAWDKDGNLTPQTKIGNLRFINSRIRDLAFIILAGRLAVWWWGATGDDFDVTKGLLTAFPISPSQLEPIADQLLPLVARLRAEQQRNPLVTLYSGKYMGNYDMNRCRHITDEADRLVLDHLGLGHLWQGILVADASLVKTTAESGEIRRQWPFEWVPTIAE